MIWKCGSIIVLSPWNSKDRAIHTEIPQPK